MLIRCAGTAVLLLGNAAAHAQQVLVTEPIKVILEGFANATAGGSVRGNVSLSGATGETNSTHADAGVRLYAEYKLGEQRVLGLRLDVNASSQDPLAVGERSLIYIDSFGRFEIGRRRGLPDSLTGYAPNTYAFTSAEFGVNSGRTLDPGSTLATSFLPSTLADRINAVSGNGANSAFFSDASPKLVYVSPKVWGTQLGTSFAPKIDQGSAPGNPYKQLFQLGLAYQEDFGQDFYRVGGSFSQASLAANPLGLAGALPTSDLRSLSLGAELNLGEVWSFGVNASKNSSDSAINAVSPLYGAHGITASANYNGGEWVYGAYLQRAVGGTGLNGRDDLSVAQVGVAYRLDTQFRIFAAYYVYRLGNQAPVLNNANQPGRGAVLLVGVRLIL